MIRSSAQRQEGYQKKWEREVEVRSLEALKYRRGFWDLILSTMGSLGEGKLHNHVCLWGKVYEVYMDTR
jgi:hypothetical protein